MGKAPSSSAAASGIAEGARVLLKEMRYRPEKVGMVGTVIAVKKGKVHLQLDAESEPIVVWPGVTGELEITSASPMPRRSTQTSSMSSRPSPRISQPNRPEPPLPPTPPTPPTPTRNPPTPEPQMTEQELFGSDDDT